MVDALRQAIDKKLDAELCAHRAADSRKHADQYDHVRDGLKLDITKKKTSRPVGVLAKIVHSGHSPAVEIRVNMSTGDYRQRPAYSTGDQQTPSAALSSCKRAVRKNLNKLGRGALSPQFWGANADDLQTANSVTVRANAASLEITITRGLLHAYCPDFASL